MASQYCESSNDFLDFYYLKDYLNNCNIGIYVASQWIALIANEPSNLQDLRHWSHVCGFSFKWLCWWSFRWCVRVAECTHYVHLIGFSLMWVLRCDGWWNDLKQWSHLCGFLPLCVTRWTLRILAPVAERSHIVHLFLLSPVLVYMKWCFIILAWPNVLLHC